MSPLLEVRDYTLDYGTASGSARVLDGVSFQIGRGEVLGLVGESGSGKSSLAWAIMRHLAGNARERGGQIRLLDMDLRSCSERQMQAVRGRRIGMVFQDPAASLNPTLPLGRQIAEVLARHRGLNRKAAWRAAVEALGHVDLKDPAAMMRRYPHEVSGGEKQRVMIASAFACRPELIIFDEPTTALDVITGARILDLFRRLREETGVAALYISHDLALVARVADRLAVLQKGRVVETGAPGRIFAAPGTPYTRALVDAVPRPGQRLVQDRPDPAPLLAARGVSVAYGKRRLLARHSPVWAARDVHLEIRRGEILGLVGESGSGKSTMARAITGLTPFSGSLDVNGRCVTSLKDMGRDYRRMVQIVFQHPDSSLNPRHRVDALLARPLHLYGGSRDDIPALLEQVRLPASFASRYPHQLSGGEKQRVAIARAFAAKPALVVCDEITAPLDVSVQASVIELLLDLRRRSGTAYLFITHDLNLVRQIAHRIAVMRRGEVVDLRDVDTLDDDDVHPYTRELVAASPVPVGGEQV